ncbi:MAG: 50S ribosomal protein L22 [Candidatus Diapherotrites archaeon]
MVKEKYQAIEARDEITAKAMLKNKPVSLKYSTEICNLIRGQPVAKAERLLNEIIAHKKFLPLLKYKKKVPHRKGQSFAGTKAGRYPENTCKAFLELLGYAKANAENKGLDSEKLLIRHCFASKGFRRFKMQPKGRIAGKRRRAKSAHLEVILQEVESI